MLLSVFSILLGTLSFTQPIHSKFQLDTLVNKEIKEITIVGGLSSTFALPMVVVDKKTLDASSFFSPADALRRETGISIIRDAIWATSLSIRGLSEQRLIVMIDGDRIQPATDHSAALSVVDMNSLEKIEVIQGASSVLYGTGAMGGEIGRAS